MMSIQRKAFSEMTVIVGGTCGMRKAYIADRYRCFLLGRGGEVSGFPKGLAVFWAGSDSTFYQTDHEGKPKSASFSKFINLFSIFLKRKMYEIQAQRWEFWGEMVLPRLGYSMKESSKVIVILWAAGRSISSLKKPLHRNRPGAQFHLTMVLRCLRPDRLPSTKAMTQEVQ